MTDQSLFLLYETEKPAKEPLNVVIKPDSSIRKYQYQVFKNEEIYMESSVGSEETTVLLEEDGKYQIVVTVEKRNTNVT